MQGTADASEPESACFVIADISGYTSFLAGVELDHAQDIIADLMDTVVRCLRPPFRFAKFEGDAAFFYAISEQPRGQAGDPEQRGEAAAASQILLRRHGLRYARDR